MEKLNLGERIIKASFNFSVNLIERFSEMKELEDKVEQLRKLPKDTLGNDIACCLDAHRLKLVPNYESHDLKHVLLDYKMTPLDEIRMQAFMLGNGNHTIPCYTILIFGMLLLPTKWNIFLKEYRKGRNAKAIYNWTIDQYAELKTQDLRKMIIKDIQTQAVFTIERFIKMGAFAAIAAGVSGMVFCLPFLFSSSMEDLVGAGFPFIGGCILAIGGLLALSNISKLQLQAEYNRGN